MYSSEDSINGKLHIPQYKAIPEFSILKKQKILILNEALIVYMKHS